MISSSIRRSAAVSIRSIASRRMMASSSSSSVSPASISSLANPDISNPASWPSVKDTMLSKSYHEYEHAKGSTKFWFWLNVVGVAPAMIALCLWIFPGEIAHLKHMYEHPHEHIAFPHLRRRKNAFPWGDGDKSLFHTDAANSPPADA